MTHGTLPGICVESRIESGEVPGSDVRGHQMLLSTDGVWEPHAHLFQYIPLLRTASSVTGSA